MKPAFERYIGIDYSGAQTPTSSLKGLRVYAADRLNTPREVEPPPSPRKYWTRKGIADWLVEKLSEGPPTLVGIEHAFSFPIQYFEHHGLPLDGRPSLMISSATGRLMRTSTSISFATAAQEMAQPAQGIPGGGG